MSYRAFAMVLACYSVVTLAAATDNMRAFPPAANGMKRYVLTHPQDEDETRLRVEVVIGKNVRVDPNNRYLFGGKVETKVAQGWGFSYYVLPKLGPMAGTRMAVDPAAPQVERFIAIGGEPLLLRYNSKLPLVVYVPEDVEVRYRIWRTPAETIRMNPG